MILVICESGGKIEKIQHILGDNYIVIASYGHIIDLDKHDISINFSDNFQPIYKVLDGKEIVISKLQKAFSKCDDVLLATDKDREGEMIAWSLARELKIDNPKRIAFTSITKKDLLDAVKHPCKINNDLVDAQKLRRLLDRIIGYRISPLLWKSIGSGQLSAGRVQSVVVKLIIEKENEIKDFFKCDSVSFFKTYGEFMDKNKKIFKSYLYIKDQDGDIKKGKISQIIKLEEAKIVMKQIMKSSFKISDFNERESLRYPSPPFTTSTLQQEASRKYGFSAKRTMTTAQHLYEAGFITYMRTDSMNLSDEALKSIGDFVISKYNNEYYKKTNYTSKVKNTQEAHEAVRPTDVKVLGISDNSKSKIGVDEIKLYSLIWKRSVASQMTPAKFNIISIQIDISKCNDYYFVSQIEKNIFPGFLTVYNLSNIEHDDKNDDDKNDDNKNDDDKNDDKNDDDIIIPKIGSKLDIKIVNSTQEYKRPPTRYNEATLISKIDPKNLNIGRPSTYASIIDKIQNTGYVNKEDNEGIEKESIVLSWDGEAKIEEDIKKIILGNDKNKFVPSSLGILVNDFLIQYFPNIMDYKFTADMEDQLDDVASGKLKWNIVLENFYKTFQLLIEKLNNTIKPKEIVDKYERVLGNHPESGKKIVATIAKYGSIVKLIDNEKKSKSIIAPIKKPLTLENITIVDALKLFEFPKTLGKYGKKIATLNRGKYGYYLKVGEIKISLDITEEDISEFDIDDAIKAIAEKNKNILWQIEDATNNYIILDGKYGKYINTKPLKGKKKAKNYKLPEDINIDDLTLEKILDIISNSYKNRGRKKSTKQKPIDENNETDKKPKKVIKKKTIKS